MADRTVKVKLVADTLQYDPKIEKSAKATDMLGTSVDTTAKKHKSAWNEIGKGGAVAAVVGVAAVGAMVKSFMDFDHTMSEVQAATRATGSELSALREAALEAGKATVFSATEAAQAEVELSKAGVSTGDILGGALTGALDLASAGQLDVADAANIAATAMTQFGLSGKDVPHIADLLAAGAGKAQGEVSDLAVALKYVGPVAHQMGISIEETTGTLAELASNGILADQAGTSLRGILSGLTSPSKAAAKEMHELGINVYDAQGNFVGFDGVAGQLHDKLGKLTNAQRDSALGTIFGNEQITAARILYAGGADAVDDWTKKVNDSGFAQEQAAAKLNNLSGDLESLRGSIETTLIQGGSAANGTLRVLVQTATGVVNVFADLPGPMQATAVGLIAVTAAGGGALAFFGTVVPKVKAYRTELEGMGRAGSVANSAIGIGGKVLGGAIPLFAAASTVVELYNRKNQESASRVQDLTQAIIADNGALGENTKAKVANILQDQGALDAARQFHLNLQDVTDAALGNTDALGRVNAVLDAYKAAQQEAASAGDTVNITAHDTNQAYTKLRDAISGSNTEVNKSVQAARNQADAQGTVKSKTTQAASAIDTANVSTKAFTGTVQDATGQLTKYDTAADAVKASIDALNGTTIAAAEADIDFRNQVATATKALHDNGRSLDLNSQKGRDNRTAIINAIKAANQHAQAVADQTGKVELGTKAFGDDISTLRRVLTQSGLTKKQVDAMIDSYGRVPTATRGAGKGLDGASRSAQNAASKMNAVTRAANGIPKSVTTKVTAVVSVVDAISARLATPNRTGGNSTTNQGGLATGGWVPGDSPSDTADNIPATIGGRRSLWLTGDEFVINRPRARSIRRSHPGLLEAINAGQVDIGGDPDGLVARYGKALRFAAGGSIPAVQQFMRSTDPKPYVWGAVGPSAYDCSGLAGEIYNRLLGKASYHRQFTTSSNFTSLGFRRGKGTFTVGLNPGQHMDSNLAGYQAEARSTATGIFTGSAATPVTHFAQQWYLPQIGGRFVNTGGSLELTNRQKAQVFSLIRPQIAQQVTSMLQRRAAGGPVNAGQLYRVNERGGEGYFVPPADGNIVPAHGMSARNITAAGGGDRMAASIVTELGRLRAALAMTRGPLVQVDHMEMADPVSVDLLGQRLAFLEGVSAGGFS